MSVWLGKKYSGVVGGMTTCGNTLLSMPDGSIELFEVVDISDHSVAVMTKNIIDFTPFNDKNNKRSGNVNSYTESSIRSYLKGLYQTVIKENELLENYTIGKKEFLLVSSVNLGLMSGRCGWQAFKDSDSRVKYPGTFAATKDEAYGPGEADWYWTSTPSAALANSVRHVNSDGTLGYNFACLGSSGVAPALSLHPSASVAYADGVWHLYESDVSETAYKESAELENIIVGDWVDVVKATNVDNEARVFAGELYEVVDIKNGGVCIRKGPRTHHFLSVGKFKRNKRVSNKRRATRTEVKASKQGNGVIDTNQIAKVFDAGSNDTMPKHNECKLSSNTMSKQETLVRSYTENLNELLMTKENHHRSGAISLMEKLKQLNELLEEEVKLNKAINTLLMDIASLAMSDLITRENKLSDGDE